MKGPYRGNLEANGEEKCHRTGWPNPWKDTNECPEQDPQET